METHTTHPLLWPKRTWWWWWCSLDLNETSHCKLLIKVTTWIGTHISWNHLLGLRRIKCAISYELLELFVIARPMTGWISKRASNNNYYEFQRVSEKILFEICEKSLLGVHTSSKAARLNKICFPPAGNQIGGMLNKLEVEVPQFRVVNYKNELEHFLDGKGLPCWSIVNVFLGSLFSSKLK